VAEGALQSSSCNRAMIEPQQGAIIQYAATMRSYDVVISCSMLQVGFRTRHPVRQTRHSLRLPCAKPDIPWLSAKPDIPCASEAELQSRQFKSDANKLFSAGKGAGRD
jgi:hypothetical protein